MLEPTWNPIAMPAARLTGGPPRHRVNRWSAKAETPNREWWVCAAPFSVAAIWIAATGASFLYWSVTGRQEPLDWCRSGGVLTAAAALAAFAALVASLLNGVPEGPFRFVNRKRAEGFSLHPQTAPAIPVPHEGTRQSWFDAMDVAATDY